MDFPSNSKNVVGKPAPEKEPVVKVVTTEVVQRKPSIGRRFKSIFFGGEFKSASSYVLMDVLLPALKNTTVDMVSKGIERIVYGDAKPARRFIDPNRPTVSYNRFSTPSSSRSRVMLPDQPPITPLRRRADFGEVLIVSKEEADLVLERMTDILEKYDVVSVADLNDLVGLPTTHIDNKWGWQSLSGVQVRQTREGYLIDLPAPEPI